MHLAKEGLFNSVLSVTALFFIYTDYPLFIRFACYYVKNYETINSAA